VSCDEIHINEQTHTKEWKEKASRVESNFSAQLLD